MFTRAYYCKATVLIVRKKGMKGEYCGLIEVFMREEDRARCSG